MRDTISAAQIAAADDTAERIRQMHFSSAETWAKTHAELFRPWLRVEAKYHGFPPARLAAALATELIGIAIDEIHTRD